MKPNPSNCWASAIWFAAGEVDKLAAHLVGNTKSNRQRDPAIYEQGIGCKRAAKMLREIAKLDEIQHRTDSGFDAARKPTVSTQIKQSKKWLLSQNTCMKCGAFMPKNSRCKCQ